VPGPIGGEIVMRILVVGSGGREHALVWKLLQSKGVEKVYCLPGNAGMEGPKAERAPVNIKDPAALRWIENAKPHLVVIGPEGPLSEGLADKLRESGLRVFGPGKEAARLESSKIFAKQFMAKHKIPTAPFETFEDPAKARAYIASRPYDAPLVVKADGLAGGKGVRVCSNREEALGAVADFMETRSLGASGQNVVIEDKLEGPELSWMALCDGTTLRALPPSRDHKRAFDGDRGPNTGGMGAFAPCPVPPEDVDKIREQVLNRFLAGLKADGLEYRGAIYFGLMLTKDGPKVLEFNVRFGDPETQAVLPLISSDFADALAKTAEGKLAEAELKSSGQSAVCVVVASEGYPGPSKTGRLLMGLDTNEALIFHAGTDRIRGRWVTGGGRVAGVTGVADTLEAARDAAYAAAAKVFFEGRHYRKDIALSAVETK
jgi:phosphoribosylamine--glycine ligase